MQLSHLKKTVNFYFPVKKQYDVLLFRLQNALFSSSDTCNPALFFGHGTFYLVWSGQQSASKVEIQLIINHNLHSEIQAESLPG